MSMPRLTCFKRLSDSMERCVLVAVMIAALQAGCWKLPPVEVTNAPAGTTVVSHSPEVTATKAAAKESEQPQVPAALASLTPNSEPEKTVAPGAGSVSKAPTDAKPEQVAPAPSPSIPERILLFTPSGPLLVHLHILFDDQPHRVAADEWLSRLVMAIGGTGGREVNWTDLVAERRIAQGRLGNTPLPGDKERADAIRQFDLNRDGRVQMGELAALFSRNSAVQRPFGLQAIASSENGLQSGPLYSLLDVDRDGRLSDAEIKAATVRLQTRDADDNEVVVMTDLREARPTDEAPLGRTDIEPDLALDLTETLPDVLYYTLCEIYNESGRLDAEALALVPSLLKFLDVDGNGAVDVKEVARLNEAPPSLVLTINFATDRAREVRPRISVTTIADELSAAGVAIHDRLGQIDLELPGGGLELSAVDVFRTQILDVPSLFATLDADKSGLLETNEQPPLLGAINLPLAEVDRDADAKLSLSECQSAVVDSQPFSAVQVQAGVSHAADALFAILDEQRDGRLTSREIRGAPQKLAALDHDGDGQVTPDEIPPRLTLVVSRGTQGRTEGMVPAGGPLPSEGPAWMTAMDRNRDGEVSPREFLGTRAQFSQWDADGDGYLSAKEASAAASGDP